MQFTQKSGNHQLEVTSIQIVGASTGKFRKFSCFKLNAKVFITTHVVDHAISYSGTRFRVFSCFLCVVCAVNSSLQLYLSLLAAATHLNLVLGQSGPLREFVNEQWSSVAATATLNPPSIHHLHTLLLFPVSLLSCLFWLGLCLILALRRSRRTWSQYAAPYGRGSLSSTP